MHAGRPHRVQLSPVGRSGWRTQTAGGAAPTGSRPWAGGDRAEELTLPGSPGYGAARFQPVCTGPPGSTPPEPARWGRPAGSP